ncbi:hypothetical protein MTR67_002014 [Solanum verrucosum]|uniref:Uncharacterized protein n=1 Tax=Solanum verrucosum TaxID=315347 RepID=A0AAF0PVD6_SOLVR|nr:hypothetical protein MTR67_002014 [Solanum verrucosum]
MGGGFSGGKEWYLKEKRRRDWWKKALNDISKPSALQASKKKIPQMKALADLTNSTKSSSVAESELCQSTEKGHGHELFSQGSWIRSCSPLADDVPVHLGASPHALELSMKSKSSTYQPGSPTKHYVQVEELPELIFYDQEGDQGQLSVLTYASRGYIVVAIDSPMDTNMTTYRDVRTGAFALCFSFTLGYFLIQKSTPSPTAASDAKPCKVGTLPTYNISFKCDERAEKTK